MALTQVASGLIASVSGASLTGTQTIPKATLPTGCILQVVQGTTSTAVTSTNSSYVDSGLTATITPSSTSSKILVMVSQCDCSRGNSSWAVNTSLALKLVRNGSDVIVFNPNTMYLSNSSVGGNVNISGQYLDSPASTSALTYKTQFQNAGNVGSGQTVGVQWNSGSSTSSIVLMEIAA